MFKTETDAKSTAKAELTRLKILDAALQMFRTRGFDQSTMRDVASAAGVATGAAYYYYPSKDALVLAFYERCCREIEPRIRAALETHTEGGLEDRLKSLIAVKLEYFAPYRSVLRALLKNGADPVHPLSPFAPNNRAIREADLLGFQNILRQSRTRLPQDLEPYMPELLWLFQMGVIYFWVTDDSRAQQRTDRLLALGAKIVATLTKIASLPLTKPLRRFAVELIEVVKSS